MPSMNDQSGVKSDPTYHRSAMYILNNTYAVPLNIDILLIFQPK